ncbi:MAG: hypothetical protein KC800_10530 [Candidatus Eremiobacteraeota bacterium]|nr:hypothetical protein [Candidatus Eremiobacteraeota bacterium]
MRFPLLIALLCLWLPWVTGCSKNYTYTNPEYKISLTYPGNVDLFDDKETLLEKSGQKESNEQALDHPELLFAFVTMHQGQLTGSVHQLPKDVQLTADEYFEASTAKELSALGAEIVEPRTEVVLDGKDFHTVGFKLALGEQNVRSRIYEYLDPKSGRILVLTASALESNWASESPVMESMVKSLKVGW